MRVALIDIGTNSIRLDVYQLYAHGECERLQRRKVMVRLGQDVFLHARLHSDGIKRALQALASFAGECDELCVDSIRAIATSAVRQAENAEEFIKAAKKKTGIEVETITGKEEAELILQGIMQDPRTNTGHFGFIDIGGGSTEIGVLQRGKVVFLDSLPIGAARLHQLHFGKDSSGEIREARHSVSSVLNLHLPSSLPKVGLMLGSSGTVNALQKIFRTAGKGAPIRIEPLSVLVHELAALTLKQRKKYPGLNAKRADIIVPGAIILHEAMVALRTPTVHFTKYALRDGLLAAATSAHSQQQPTRRLKRLK